MVAACQAFEAIIAPQAIEGVCRCITPDRVSFDSAGHVFDGDQHIALGRARVIGSRGQINDNERRFIVILRNIDAGATIQPVRALTASQFIIAVTGLEVVVPLVAMKRVVSSSCDDQVIAAIAPDGIGGSITAQRVRKLGASESLDSRERVALGRAAQSDAGCQIDADRRLAFPVIGGIEPCAADQGVRPAPADQAVITCASIEPIHSAFADQHVGAAQAEKRVRAHAAANGIVGIAPSQGLRGIGFRGANGHGRHAGRKDKV